MPKKYQCGRQGSTLLDQSVFQEVEPLAGLRVTDPAKSSTSGLSIRTQRFEPYLMVISALRLSFVVGRIAKGETRYGPQRHAHIVAGLVLERPAKRQSLHALTDALEASGREIDGRLQSLWESPANVKQLRHIIGIERWGQRRLRVALGEPPLLDEYNDYQPIADLSWDDLRGAFRTTRAETVALARTLAAHEPDSLTKVRHNQAGPLSIPAWVQYLKNHARRESMWIK